ncbi:MAG: hypothetical protein KF764_35160 [Labilithrix sp.]|nr:hypothetical protein [Labilithrix sp.]MBX3224864.1 hypothetical protein [Labilithrix sp.]
MNPVRPASVALASLASLASLAALAACRTPEPAPPPATVEIATTDAAPPATGPADAGALTEERAKTPPPPSGTYAVAVQERSSTCALDAAPGATSGDAPLWVLVNPTRDGKWTATLPVNTGGGSLAIDRHDLLLETGHVETSSLRPDRTCAYEVTREMRVLDVTPTRIVVEVKAEYTDAVRCSLPRRPVACKRDVVVTYTLATPFCAPGCAAQMTLLRDGGAGATCMCP